MTANHFRIAALLVALAALFTLSTMTRDERVQAQPPAVASIPVGRFQISAYSAESPAELNPGCYIVDTATGRVWHTRLGAGLVEVNEQPLLGAP